VLFAVAAVSLTMLVGTLVGILLHQLGRVMSVIVGTAALLAWATPPVSASVLFYWLFNPDGGLVDWSLARLPHWLVGSTDWAGFNWTTSGALALILTVILLIITVGYVRASVRQGALT
jgi:N,N'-diacetylchitobiose transport system permease protein